MEHQNRVAWPNKVAYTRERLHIQERSLDDLEYCPKPFLEDQFKPLEWTHVLATLDVCTNEATQIKFCDEEGHEI